MSYDIAQTFYVDSAAVQKSDDAFITSVELFFFSKPAPAKAASGISSPGITVYIAACKTDGSPDLGTIHPIWSGRQEYGNIITSSTGATSTKFSFRQPVRVYTNRRYALVVQFDGSDPGFKLWYNKAGELKLGDVSRTQVTAGKVDGWFYRITNGSTLTADKTSDLTFKVNVAKFNVTSREYKVKSAPYEILESYNINGKFTGGEDVYQQRTPLTGTVDTTQTTKTLIGTGTSFNSTLHTNDMIVVTDGSAGNTSVVKVTAVTNATHCTVTPSLNFSNTTAYYYKTVVGQVLVSDNVKDTLVIANSTANSTVYLSVDSTVVGVDSLATANISAITSYAVNGVRPDFGVKKPKGTSTTGQIVFANTSGSVDSTNALDYVMHGKLPVIIDAYPAIIASATAEATNATPFTSCSASLVFNTDNPYASPYVREDLLDLFVEKYEINNDSTNEHTNTGNAKSRWISKTINLASEQFAEDMKVYARVFKPTGTDIKVYVKFKHITDSESIGNKIWTELAPTDPNLKYSTLSNKRDFIELSYDVPFFQPGIQAGGTFATQLANAVVLGSTTSVNTDILPGDVVRVYSPSLPNTYFVDVVTASNTTSFTVATAVANSTLATDGLLVDKITVKNAAFLDVQNHNVLTYFNSTGGRIKSFDTFKIKVVMLSEDGVKVPIIEDVRAIAVSA